MKRNKMALILCLCTMCMVQVGSLSVSAAVVEAAVSTNTNAITPRGDTIIWKYKAVNGKQYKRQYNVTKSKWIGDWIPM